MKSQRPLAGGSGGVFFPLFQYIKDKFDPTGDPEFVVDVDAPNRDYPWGFAMNLEDRIIRARSAIDPAKPQLLKPG